MKIGINECSCYLIQNLSSQSCRDTGVPISRLNTELKRHANKLEAAINDILASLPKMKAAIQKIQDGGHELRLVIKAKTESRKASDSKTKKTQLCHAQRGLEGENRAKNAKRKWGQQQLTKQWVEWARQRGRHDTKNSQLEFTDEDRRFLHEIRISLD